MPRPHGTGSVFRRASDGRWCAIVELPRGPDGKRNRKTLYGADEHDVRDQLAALRRQVARGEHEPSRQTLEDYLLQWLRDAVEPIVFRRTAQQYESIIRARLIPTLGAIPLGKLTGPEIQKAYTQLAKVYKPSTLGATHRLLVQALEQAVAWELLPRNPARHVRRSRAERAEPPVLSPTEQEQVIAALAGHRDEACWLLALTTGLRIGELLGLRWRDVDFDAQRVRVRQQSQYVRREGFTTRAPKTRAGTRVVPLDDLAAAALRRHRSRQREHRLQVGSAWHDEDLVFPRADGRAQQPAQITKRWKTVARRLDLAWVHPHTFRHTWASVAIGLRMPLPEVARRLGHANAAVTMGVYAHFIPGAESPAADELEAYWRSREGPGQVGHEG